MESVYLNARFRILVQCSTFRHGFSYPPMSIFTCTMDCIRFQRVLLQTKGVILARMNASRAYACIHVFPRVRTCRTLLLMTDEESSKIGHPRSSSASVLRYNKGGTGSVDKKEDSVCDNLFEGTNEVADCGFGFAKSSKNMSDKEIQRRWKIGLANKGKTPWNKGRKHTEETRERIKKKTIEALRDPKVRKKMSEHPRSHSMQSKARISIGLKKIWEERLKYRRAQEKCYSMWASSVAEAAKRGGYDEDEFDWDSYQKMKADIDYQFLQRRVDKARAKEIAKLRSQRAAKIRAEKIAQQRKEKEQKAKAREAKALARKKPANERNKTVASKTLKLKARLTKFHHCLKQLESTSLHRKRAIGSAPAIEEWDMELIKLEKMRKKASLAEQIQAVKNRKAEVAPEEAVALTAELDSSLVEEQAEDSLYS